VFVVGVVNTGIINTSAILGFVGFVGFVVFFGIVGIVDVIGGGIAVFACLMQLPAPYVWICPLDGSVNCQYFFLLN
jgi:hypothetical protein